MTLTGATPESTAPWQRLGIAIGHGTNEDGATGCTVIRGIDTAFRCAAYRLGRASGTRELATCEPDHLVDRVDAVLLAGGSAYGLDAAAGVMRWMEEQGRGFPIGTGVVPIVPAAVIFDLLPLGRFDARPTPLMAYEACAGASATDVPEGSVGVGTGATVGKAAGSAFAMKGGVGVASVEGNGVLVAALVVTNALGDVRDGEGHIIAGARGVDGFIDAERMLRGDVAAGVSSGPSSEEWNGRRNTTLGLVAVSALLSRVELAQVAAAAAGAFHRRIAPAGTRVDGDVIFAVCQSTGNEASMSTVEALAVAAMEQAIERSVRLAKGREGVPGVADVPTAASSARSTP